MALSDEEVKSIADKLVRRILTEVGAPIYVEPKSVPQALEASMHEEQVAADFYRRRAAYSETQGDKKSAVLWRHVADEEDAHYEEFKGRLDEPMHQFWQVLKGKGEFSGSEQELTETMSQNLTKLIQESATKLEEENPKQNPMRPADFPNMSWEFLVSQESHGYNVYFSRQGYIYVVAKGYPPREGSRHVPLVICEYHQSSKFAPGPEQFEDIFRCTSCFHLTQAANPTVHFRHIMPLFDIESESF
jgi:rubrerythrin